MAKRSVTGERALKVGRLACGIEGRVSIEAIAECLDTYPHRIRQAVEHWNEYDANPRTGWCGALLVQEGQWLRRMTRDEIHAVYDGIRQLDAWGTD